MKYRQIDANEASRIYQSGGQVIAGRYIEGMSAPEILTAPMLLAVELPKPAEVTPEPEAPKPCATSHTDNPDSPSKSPEKLKPDARSQKSQSIPPKTAITAREVAEMKLRGAKRAEMAEHFGVTPKQMTAWMWNHKADVEEAVQQLQGARELAAKVFEDKEDTDGEHQN